MGKLIEVVIDSLRVSLTNQQRVVILHEQGSENYLPIWIGPYEAEAITIALQEVEVSRPLTHDLLKNVFQRLNARLIRAEVCALKDDVFYGKIIAVVNDVEVEIDSRPSDMIALAVRAHIPIFVAQEVLSKAAVHPEPEGDAAAHTETPQMDTEGQEKAPLKDLTIFEEFIDKLNLDDLPPESTPPGDKSPE